MSTQRYDHVVVGAGISGMTAALLLGQHGRKVLLVEKAPRIGGSMARFSCQGLPFDTGFHFTGGLEPGGLLNDMLKALNIEDLIEPLRLDGENAERFVFEHSGSEFGFPETKAGLIQCLKEGFPDEHNAIDDYFKRVEDVCSKTVNMDLRSLGNLHDFLDEDYITLQAVLDELTENAELKALLGAYCMCYGVAPREVSFANHARMCQGIYEGRMRVRNGGDAFVQAFDAAFKAVDVEVLCGRHIIACEDIADGSIGAFILSSGERVEFESCLLTIHPKDILDLLPREMFRKAFCSRVDEFESSVGFFALFAVLDDKDAIPDSMITLFPNADLNRMLLPGESNDDSALFLISGLEETDHGDARTLTALEVLCPEDCDQWAGSSLMKRPASYDAFKQAKTDRIVQRISEHVPEIAGRFKVLTSSTSLTFRDYLNSPDGSAYGVKQKLGQHNLFGRLPVRNLYAAGQSALLPGVMGAMMSSFIVCRTLIGSKEFDDQMHRRLN